MEVDSCWSALRLTRCVLCNARCAARAVCTGCHADLPWFPGPDRFRVPSTQPARGGPDDAARHGARGALQRLTAALAYEYPVDRIVTLAKFHQRLDCARSLGELLADCLEDRRKEAATIDVIVPVPLHRQRLARRGYNQALEIARPIARRRRLPLDPGLCMRVRATEEQSGLSATHRRRNVRGAFLAEPACEGLQIAVVDDVVTTGSTVAEVVRALRKAGAETVEVWAAARVL